MSTIVYIVGPVEEENLQSLTSSTDVGTEISEGRSRDSPSTERIQSSQYGRDQKQVYREGIMKLHLKHKYE